LGPKPGPRSEPRSRNSPRKGEFLVQNPCSRAVWGLGFFIVHLGTLGPQILVPRLGESVFAVRSKLLQVMCAVGAEHISGSGKPRSGGVPDPRIWPDLVPDPRIWR